MNPDSGILSTTARYLLYGVAGLFALLGIIFFAAPAWAATNFLWKVSPFVTMTIGGWYIGNAIFAWDSAHTGRWPAIYPSLITLSAFSVLETTVIVLHRDLLRLSFALSWFYLFTLAAAVVVAIMCVTVWLRQRPTIKRAGTTVPRWITALVGLFGLFVLALAIAGALGPSAAADGTVFPEKISAFTIHAFVAFSLALAVGGFAWLFFSPNAQALITFVRDGLALLILLTLATLANLGQFDFAARPGGLIYLSAYIVALITFALILGYSWMRRMWTTAPQHV